MDATKYLKENYGLDPSDINETHESINIGQVELVASKLGLERTKPLEFYLIGDQPTVCPKCGTRSDFSETNLDGQLCQIHLCPACNYSFATGE